MRLSVHHLTRFEFDQASGHSIHDVRLTPKPAAAQRIVRMLDGRILPAEPGTEPRRGAGLPVEAL